MTDRILDLSDKPARLSVRNGLLVISLNVAQGPPSDPAALQGGSAARQETPGNAAMPESGHCATELDSRPSAGSGQALRGNDGDGGGDTAATKTYRCERLPDPNEHTVPLADIAVLIAAHPQISFSHAVLAGIAEAGGTFIVSNEKRMPCAMLLPLETHSTQTERFAAQAAASLPLRKRVWQEIVQAQIRARARLLVERTGKDYGLGPMAARVRSGDPQNLEAQAARIYWRALFGDEFHRDREEEGLNSCLNYGNGVLRAIVARALCAAGLHPALGLHHHNRYDTFCLADDLMEPFRPLVDRVVASISDRREEERRSETAATATPVIPAKAGIQTIALDRDTKKSILEGLLARYTAGGESRTLFDWVSRAASSLAAVIEGREQRLGIPDLVLSGASFQASDS